MENFEDTSQSVTDPNDETLPLCGVSDEPIAKPKSVSERFCTTCRVFLSQEVLLCSIPSIVASIFNGIISVYLSPLVTRLLDIPEERAGFYFMTPALASSMSSPLWGYLVECKLNWSLYTFSSLAATISCLLLLHVVTQEDFPYHKVVLLVALLLFGMSCCSGFVSGLLIMSEVFQKKLDGVCSSGEVMFLASAWNNSCFTGGRSIGSICVGGVIFDLTGYQGVIWTQLGLNIVALLSIIFYFLIFVRLSSSEFDQKVETTLERK